MATCFNVGDCWWEEDAQESQHCIRRSSPVSSDSCNLTALAGRHTMSAWSLGLTGAALLIVRGVGRHVVLGRCWIYGLTTIDINKQCILQIHFINLRLPGSSHFNIVCSNNSSRER